MLFSLLCMVFHVQAEEVTKLSQLNNDAVYTLRSERAFLLYSANVPGQICGSTGKMVGSVTQSKEDTNQQFKIEKKGDSYYLYSVGAGKYLNANGGYVDTALTPLTLTNVGGEYPWLLLLGYNGMNSQVQDQMDAGIVVNSYKTQDPGNCYKIELAAMPVRTITIKVLGTDDACPFDS